MGLSGIGDCDFGGGRPALDAAARERVRRVRLESARLQGYSVLMDLCRLGEVDEARRLADRNPQWGYAVLDGMVVSRDSL